MSRENAEEFLQTSTIAEVVHVATIYRLSAMVD